MGITDASDDGIPSEEEMNELTTILKEQFEKEQTMKLKSNCQRSDLPCKG